MSIAKRIKKIFCSLTVNENGTLNFVSNEIFRMLVDVCRKWDGSEKKREVSAKEMWFSCWKRLETNSLQNKQLICLQHEIMSSKIFKIRKYLRFKKNCRVDWTIPVFGRNRHYVDLYLENHNTIVTNFCISRYMCMTCTVCLCTASYILEYNVIIDDINVSHITIKKMQAHFQKGLTKKWFVCAQC